MIQDDKKYWNDATVETILMQSPEATYKAAQVLVDKTAKVSDLQHQLKILSARTTTELIEAKELKTAEARKCALESDPAIIELQQQILTAKTEKDKAQNILKYWEDVFKAGRKIATIRERDYNAQRKWGLDPRMC